MEEIGEVQNALFQDLCMEGELDEFLRARGWRADAESCSESTFDLPYLPQLVKNQDDLAAVPH